jgi:hypothetical protein
MAYQIVLPAPPVPEEEPVRCDPVELNTRPRPADMACIVCGCTDGHACAGGCYWISADPPVCSACEDVAADMLADGPVEATSGFFGEQLCPASATPALHAPIFTDANSGHCARCKLGFVL